VYRHAGKLDLFVAHRRELVNYAQGILRNPAHAEDVVQDAWLKFSAPSAWPASEEPVGYLYRIVRNLAIDATRRLRREERVFIADGEVDTETIVEDAPSPAAEAEAKDDMRVIREAMAELPERTRLAFEMHRFGEMTFKQIAAELGISIGLAHLIVSDAIEHCRERLCKG